MENIKIRVVYIPYARYVDTATVIGHVNAESFRQAIIKLLNKIGMYADGETILEREEELGRVMTQEELIEMISAENGDGCDFIVSITNEQTGEVYLETDPGLEEWEI